MNKIRNFQALFIERFDSSISMVDNLKKFKTTIIGSISFILLQIPNSKLYFIKSLLFYTTDGAASIFFKKRSREMARTD